MAAVGPVSGLFATVCPWHASCVALRQRGASAARVGAANRVNVLMATLDIESKLIHISGENASLVARLREALNRALDDRQSFYEVRVESVGRVGEVVVSITGLRGHVPLFFGAEELEPGYVSSIVRDTVTRFGL